MINNQSLRSSRAFNGYTCLLCLGKTRVWQTLVKTVFEETQELVMLLGKSSSLQPQGFLDPETPVMLCPPLPLPPTPTQTKLLSQTALTNPHSTLNSSMVFFLLNRNKAALVYFISSLLVQCLHPDQVINTKKTGTP